VLQHEDVAVLAPPQHDDAAVLSPPQHDVPVTVVGSTDSATTPRLVTALAADA
jgi:hypothetical protein